MRSRTGKVLVGASVLAIAGGAVALFIGGGGGGAQATLSDVGRFRAGAQLGRDRAEFSARAQLLVFADPDAPGWAELEACLRDAAVEAELGAFTPVLVDARAAAGADAEAEGGLRARWGLGVVARSLSGKLLGALPLGFRCGELLGFLRQVAAENPVPAEKSPIYARLLESPEPIVDLVARGERERASKYVDFLREFEGPSSPAVIAAQAGLGQ
jgi:hypothetical protein